MVSRMFYFLKKKRSEANVAEFQHLLNTGGNYVGVWVLFFIPFSMFK